MAATGDERREVAEELRYLADSPGQPIRYAEQLRDELFDVVLGLDERWDYSGLLSTLADLIDPTCHDFGGQEGTNGEGYDFACSACGWCGDVCESNFCLHCGARVVEKGRGDG